MVRVEFVTRCTAPMQDHRRPIWAHRGDDDIRLHASKLNADARGEVIRAFFSITHIPAIPRGTLPIYNLGSREASAPRWGPIIQHLGPLPRGRGHAWSSPKCSGSKLGAGLHGEGGRPRGLWRC
jgi:hypothetical protein